MERDTSEGAHRAQVEALRRMGPEGRFVLAWRMSEDARALAVEGELRRHPEFSRDEARQVVLERTWGPELTAKVRAFRQTSE